MRVVNTPFFIVFKPDKKAYHLKGGDNWYNKQGQTRGSSCFMIVYEKRNHY